MGEINELAAAIVAFQAELVTVDKNADNPFFRSKYADLAEVLKTCQPLATKHGLGVVSLPDNFEGKPALSTYIVHKSGQHLKGTIPLTLAKEDPQAVGSAITYMRRYGYAAALQVVIDEDDDGNKASTPKQPRTNTASSTGLATPKQKNLIAELLRRNGVADEDMQSYLIEQFGVADTAKMNVQDASQIIESLK